VELRGLEPLPLPCHGGLGSAAAAASVDGVYRRAGAATSAEPGRPSVCPHTSNPTEAAPEPPFSAWEPHHGSRVGGLPGRGRPEVVRRRLQRSLLVARLWPDLTLLFAGRGGDVRCKYGQTGPWRTMPHQTTRSGIPSGASRPYAVVRSRRAMHGRHVHLPTLRWPRSDETALPSALDRHFRTRWRSPRRTSAASTAAPDCCRSCAQIAPTWE
jgi:hypothetical protein